MRSGGLEARGQPVRGKRLSVARNRSPSTSNGGDTAPPQGVWSRVFDAAPAAIAVFAGSTHRYIYSNPVNDRTVGHRPLVGRTVREALPELEGQGVFEILDEVYRTGVPFEADEFEAMMEDEAGGAPRRAVYRGVTQPWRDEAGDIAGVVNFAYDVTAQVEARERAEEAEQRLRFTLQASEAVGSYEWDVASDRVLVDVHFASVFGVPFNEASPYLKLSVYLERIHADDRERVAEAIRRAVETGEDYRAEYRVKSSDGTERAVLAFGRCRRVEGVPTRFSGVVVDLSERRRAEIALQESEARFRTITEAMPQMVWATREDGYPDFYNARWYEFTGAPRGSTDGPAWTEVFHVDDRERALERWRQAVALGEPYEIEYRLRHHTGEYRWVLGRAQPVRGEAGQIVRWLGTCTDIHEIKLVQDQRQLMLAEMNHRVKNTIAMVHAIVGQSLRQAEDLADAREVIQARLAALSAAQDRLVKDSGDNREETFARDVIDAALAPHADGSDRIRVEGGQDHALGSRQSLALTMALHELATNAAKYGALSVADGRVEIAWEAAEDGRVRLTWKERGGPPVLAPTRRGFGSRMIEQALAGYFGGEAQIAYEPDGVRFTLDAPVSGLKA